LFLVPCRKLSWHQPVFHCMLNVFYHIIRTHTTILWPFSCMCMFMYVYTCISTYNFIFWNMCINLQVRYDLVGVKSAVKIQPTNQPTALSSWLPRWAGARRNLLDFILQGEISEADTLTIQLGTTPSGLINDPPPSSPIFVPDALPSATLSIYPGLGQAQNVLACIPSGFTLRMHWWYFVDFSVLWQRYALCRMLSSYGRPMK